MSEVSNSVSDDLTLEALLDTLIPAEDGFPSAREADIRAAFLDDVETDNSHALLRGLLDALPNNYDGLSQGERESALKGIEAEDPVMFAAVVRHVFNAYYTNPKVREVLEAVEGYPARPPHYAGYELEPFDENSLATQRDRPPFWRRA